MPPLPPITVTPIGHIVSPLRTKHEAPRQPAEAADVDGRIELWPGAEYEHALEGLDGFTHLWIVSYFDRADGWRPKVQPPRSEIKRGVFATRAPRRPNPIGMSLVKLGRIEGTTLHVRGLDLLDGTPVLDLKPYLPYADVAADANSGWLSEATAATTDPGPRYTVAWGPRARTQLHWLAEHGGPALREAVDRTLTLGPTPHAYRRIKRLQDGYRLAYRDFRVRFRIQGTAVTVDGLETGYKPSVLADRAARASADTSLAIHRDFVAAFAQVGSE